jgi:hypothetical protein
VQDVDSPLWQLDAPPIARSPEGLAELVRTETFPPLRWLAEASTSTATSRAPSS